MPSGRAPARCGSAVLMRSAPRDRNGAQLDARARRAASVMKPTSVPALTKRSPSSTNSVSSSRSRIPAIPKIVLVRAARLGHRAHRVEERLVAELPEDPHLRGEVVRADHHHVEPGTDAISSARATAAGVSSITAHDGLRVEGVEQLPLRHRAGSGWRGSGRRPSGGHGAGSGTRRRSARPRRGSRRAARSRPSRRCRAQRVRYWWSCDGHPHQRRDAGADRAGAQQRRGLERDRGVLEVDVDRVEPGSPPRSSGCRRSAPASAPCTAPAARRRSARASTACPASRVTAIGRVTRLRRAP